ATGRPSSYERRTGRPAVTGPDGRPASWTPQGERREGRADSRGSLGARPQGRAASRAPKGQRTEGRPAWWTRRVGEREVLLSLAATPGPLPAAVATRLAEGRDPSSLLRGHSPGPAAAAGR